MSITITLYAWWLWAYLLAGVLMFPLVGEIGRRKIGGRPSWWAFMYPRYAGDTRGRRVRRAAIQLGAAVALWPLALWEVAR